jgi:cellulose synthase (UDP-forming)
MMNVFWIIFNCIILGTANAVAVEAQQRRGSVRLTRKMIVSIRTLSGAMISGISSDLSLGGGAISLEQVTLLEEGALIDIIYTGGEAVVLPAKVISNSGSSLRFQYRQLTLEQEEALTLVLYSRADSWLTEDHPRDRPLKSLAMIIRLSLRGIRYSFTGFLPSRKEKPINHNAEIAVLLLLGLLPLASTRLHAQRTPQPSPEHTFHSAISLADAGYNNGMMLRGWDASAKASFVLSASQVAQNGILHLRYHFSREMIPERSLLTVSFNDTTLNNLVMPLGAAKSDASDLTADIPVPANLIAAQNTLEVHLRGHYVAKCEDPTDERLWARIDQSSTFEIGGVLLPMANDLSALPAPFYEKDQTISSTSIQLAIDSSPSPTLLKAAGVRASWFGVQANSHHLIFPVALGSLPAGNVVVLARNDSPLLATLGRHPQGAHLQMIENPADHLSRVLVVSADSDDQVLAIAQTLAVGRKFSGDTADVAPAPPPPERQVGDSPRWVQTTKPSSLWSYTQTNELSTNGSQPIISYVRIPPDLYFGDQDSVKLRLQYSLSHLSPSQSAYMRVVANGSQVTYLPLSRKSSANAVQSTEIPVPVNYLRPFANTLQFQFIFADKERRDLCAAPPPSNMSGTILPSSNLDLHQFPHWTAMPNLELFANAGFPFTRFAGLSRTIVVLPQQPSAREITTMLDLLAYFGAQTGYPAIRFEIGDAKSFEQDKDLLVIGTESDILTTSAVTAALPISIEEGGLSHRVDTTLSLLRSLWTRISRFDPESFSDIQKTEEESKLDRSLSTPFDSVIEMTKSPAGRNRSVVMVVLGKGSVDTFPAFLDVSPSTQINGNVSIQHGAQFDSFSIDPSVYYVGRITALARLRARMHQAPWIGVLFPFVVGMLCAPWVHARLKDRAETRLRGDMA